MCTVTMTNRASRQLRKINERDRRRIDKWMGDNIADDPRRHGKPMTGNMSGTWAYRVGKYRMLAEIESDNVSITNVALRKESYPHHHQ